MSKGKIVRFVGGAMAAVAALGLAASAEAQEDEADRDQDVALYHGHDEVDGDHYVRDDNQQRAENQGQRRTGVGEERRGAGAAEQSARDLQPLSEDVAGRKRSHAGRGLADDRETVDDGGDPGTSVKQQRVERTEPHHLSDQRGGPAL